MKVGKLTNGLAVRLVRSHHPGGVNVTFLDGHVAFLTNDVDEIAMAYMVCINDEQPVNVGRHTF